MPINRKTDQPLICITPTFLVEYLVDEMIINSTKEEVFLVVQDGCHIKITVLNPTLKGSFIQVRVLNSVTLLIKNECGFKQIFAERIACQTSITS